MSDTGTRNANSTIRQTLTWPHATRLETRYAILETRTGITEAERVELATHLLRGLPWRIARGWSEP